MNVFDIPAVASATVLDCLEAAITKWRQDAADEGMAPDDIQRMLGAMEPELRAHAAEATRQLVRTLMSQLEANDFNNATLDALFYSGRAIMNPRTGWWSC